MASSTSQEIILTSSPDGPITAYDASNGTILARFHGSRSPRKGLLAIAGNKLFAASHVSSDTGSGSVHLYNWWSSAAFHHLPVPEPVAPLAATRDGLFLFAGGLSGHIHTLSFPSGEIIQSVPAHSKAISCLETDEDGSLLFSGSDDGTISVFPIYKFLDSSSDSRNSVLQRLNGHDASVTAIATGIGRCNCTIISSSLDCTCKFWSLMEGTILRTVKFPCTVLGVAMDPLESEFYVAGSDGSVYKGFLKVGGRHLLKKAHELVAWGQNHGSAAVDVGMANGGRSLITAAEDGYVWIWDLEGEEMVKALGDEQIGSISGMVVAKKGLGNGGGRMIGDQNNDFSGSGLGFSGREVVSRPIGEVMEMEEKLNVAIRERGRAVGTLESAIGIYEKLLQLILREAKAAGGSKKIDVDDED